MSSTLLKSMLSILIAALIASKVQAKNLHLRATSSETGNKEASTFKDYIKSLQDPDKSKDGNTANFEDADGSDTDADSEEFGDDWWSQNWNPQGHNHGCAAAYEEVHVNHNNDQVTCAEKCCNNNGCTHFKHYFIGWYGRC